MHVINWWNGTPNSEPSVPGSITKYEGVLEHNNTFDGVECLVKDAARLAYICYRAVDIEDAYPLHRAADQCKGQET